MSLRPAKTQISLGICPVWSESLQCTQWVAKGPRCPGWSESLLGAHSLCSFCHVTAFGVCFFLILGSIIYLVKSSQYFCSPTQLMIFTLNNWKIWTPEKFCNYPKTGAWQNQQNDMCSQQRLRSAQSESSLFPWRNIGSLTTFRAHSEDSDQPGQRIPKLIWVFAGCTDLFVGFVMLWLKTMLCTLHDETAPVRPVFLKTSAHYIL